MEKKNVEGFLPCIGVAAMLVIWPRYSLLAKKIHSNIFYLTSLFGAITFALIFQKICLRLSYTCAHKSGAFALSFGVTFARTFSLASC